MKIVDVYFPVHSQQALSGLEQLAVDDVETELLPGPAHPGQQIRDFLDGLNLLLQETSLQEIRQLAVFVAPCRLSGSAIRLKLN